MSEPAPPVMIAFRIPGLWTHPEELVRSLPEGYRLTGDDLLMPDGTAIEFGAGRADGEFAEIFRNSLRNPASDDELEIVDNYRVNVFLKGSGGSLDNARTMMQAAAAIVEAGGAGVFIDNSGLAHGGEQWKAMTDDGTPDALSFAFVSIVRSRLEIYTHGMHTLGYPDIVMKRSDVEGGFDIVDVIRYIAEGDTPVEDGHIIADLDGPQFVARHMGSDPKMANSPFGNPFGRLKLVSKQDIAESN
jgi:hypothetical protein